MTTSMEKQGRQTNEYQCPNCRSAHNSQILCCKFRNGFRLNHNWATWEVCVATAHLECTALSHRKRERLKGGIRTWSCCNLPATMTMQNLDLLHPLHQPTRKSFVTPVTFQSLFTITPSECHRVIKKLSQRATCTICGQSRHMTCTYLPRREGECNCDGCRELRCCGTAQSPSTNTMPSRNHPTLWCVPMTTSHSSMERQRNPWRTTISGRSH